MYNFKQTFHEIKMKSISSHNMFRKHETNQSQLYITFGHLSHSAAIVFHHLRNAGKRYSSLNVEQPVPSNVIICTISIFVEGYKCRDGFCLDKEGNCVLGAPTISPAPTPACEPNEEFSLCGNMCPWRCGEDP